MASRREFMQSLATALFGVAVGATPFALRQREALKALLTVSSATDPPWALLDPLRPGSNVGKGWRVESLGSVDRGAAVLTLANPDGRHARIHLCASKGTPIGVAHSRSVDLLLMDGGRGVSPTEEDFGRVLKGIARRITVNERAIGKDAGAFLARMQSHAERVSAYGPGTLT